MDSNLKKSYCKRPHVVILGAGASRAVMGESCPTMNDAIKRVGLDKFLQGITLETKSRNLEDIYSELFRRGDECNNARVAMEQTLYEYFSNIYLPTNLTIYDLLILALTRKDCIISFNWDSLIIQAYNRVAQITQNRPKMLFLHGNVGAGICKHCMTLGPIQNRCPQCGKPYEKTPLLYPVEQKDYNSDIFIRDQWNLAKDFISRAGNITIFGYSAPSSDKEASKILKKAFSLYEAIHRFDAIEIIERPGFNSGEISDTWKYFFSVTNDHYEIYDSFYKSSLAEAPRRTMQYQYERFFNGWCGGPNIHFSQQETFKSVAMKLKPLLANELHGDYSII